MSVEFWLFWGLGDKPWGQLVDGDNSLKLSVGSMRMQFWIRSLLYVER
jgi:hypothetical protein